MRLQTSATRERQKSKGHDGQTEHHVIEEIRLLRACFEQLQQQMHQQTRLIKAYICPGRGPGRPRHPNYSRAEQMLSKGSSWRKIYGTCLPDPAMYESREQYQDAKLRMKKAVKLRQRRAGESPNFKEEVSPSPPATNPS